MKIVAMTRDGARVKIFDDIFMAADFFRCDMHKIVQAIEKGAIPLSAESADWFVDELLEERE